MTGRFADNPCYVEYETLLKELHRLIAAGKGDTDEADAVREAMDWPERGLSRAELDRLDGLSADLYMLQGDEIYEPLAPGEDPADRAPERLGPRVAEAWARGDAETTLALLRRGDAGLPQDRIAYLRAKSCAQLGHLDSALLFAKYAAQLAPADAAYASLVGELLEKLGGSDGVSVRAPDIAAVGGDRAV